MRRSDRGKRPPDDPRRGGPRPLSALERRVLELILAFPDRIDEMETRNEENCRTLAVEIARAAEDELRRRGEVG